MMLNNVVMLASVSLRTKAYVQALKENDIHVKKIILFGPNVTADVDSNCADYNESVSVELGFAAKVNLPNLALPLYETCESIADEMILIEAESVNDEKIHNRIRELKPEVVIYSGYGGQIVSKKLLELAPFIHVHAGLLPQYRGSTTIYYSILNENNCGVSAILLEPEIDTGVVISQTTFDVPPKGIDIDHVYDGAIRASVLVDVLKEWGRVGEYPYYKEQPKDGGETYYVIHPVLKHIAVLSL